MKHIRTRGALVLAMGVVVGITLGREAMPRAAGAGPASGGAQPSDKPSTTNTTRTTKEQLERWTKELSNWGRWGKDDQLGTVNLITPAKRKQAAALVKDGIVVNLAPEMPAGKIPAEMPGPKFIGPPAGSPMHELNFPSIGSRMSYVHEQNYWLTSTHHGAHLDALCHVAFDGKTYNGFTLTEIATKDGGCQKMGIGGVKDKLVTRGILVDIARMKGLDTLPPGTHIYKEDIEAFEKWAKVRFQSGDVFLYRVGDSKGSGLDPSFIPFLKERDIALFGGESAHETFEVPGFPVAMHSLIMVPLGMQMFDNLELEALATTAAKLKRWEFMFVAVPNPMKNGTGAQINPLAIF